MVSAHAQGFHPASFVSAEIARLREVLSGKKAIAAISGGVDSTVAAFLAREALGDNLTPILIDTGFMRIDEPERVREALSRAPLNLKVRLVRASGKFLASLKGETTAEEKRRKFRETFYQVLKEEARRDGSEFLVQGTIAPDWIETQGGIKTQHNVLGQVGINPESTYGFKVVEPLSELYKDQVRTLGRHFDLPSDLAERQPFPGPGLLVRCIGNVNKAKLQILKAATRVVEERLGPTRPDQYFAAVIDNIFLADPVLKPLRETSAEALGLPVKEAHVELFDDRVTGVKGDERCYGRLAAVKLEEGSRETYGWLPAKLGILQSKIVEKFSDVTRVAFLVRERRGSRPVSVLVRAVSTRDFMTAAVTNVPWKTLKDIAEEILASTDASSVLYDITPKPPGTIEFE